LNDADRDADEQRLAEIRDERRALEAERVPALRFADRSAETEFRELDERLAELTAQEAQLRARLGGK
jgi:hypothetical protein